MGIIKNIKQNYKYFKLGRRAAFDERGNREAEINIKMLRNYGNEKMAKGMESELRKRKEKQLKSYTSFKKGGKVKKTGIYKLHKGEKVLTKAQQKSFNKSKYK